MSLKKLLETTSSPFIDMEKAKAAFSKLTKEEMKSIEKSFDLPENWSKLSEEKKIIHLSRGPNRHKLNSLV